MAAKQKILIVDDDVNIAELISLYLTKECFDTKMVHDGESALKEFETYAPNLILLDLMLPGIDGYQVCREIRAKANVPIIMLSAKGAPPLPAGEAGACTAGFKMCYLSGSGGQSFQLFRRILRQNN